MIRTFIFSIVVFFCYAVSYCQVGINNLPEKYFSENKIKKLNVFSYEKVDDNENKLLKKEYLYLPSGKVQEQITHGYSKPMIQNWQYRKTNNGDLSEVSQMGTTMQIMNYKDEFGGVFVLSEMGKIDLENDYKIETDKKNKTTTISKFKNDKLLSVIKRIYVDDRDTLVEKIYKNNGEFNEFVSVNYYEDDKLTRKVYKKASHYANAYKLYYLYDVAGRKISEVKIYKNGGFSENRFLYKKALSPYEEVTIDRSNKIAKKYIHELNEKGQRVKTKEFSYGKLHKEWAYEYEYYK